MDEDRIIDIETRLAYQEHLLSELNDALTNQQAQIGRLETMCESLIDRVKSLMDNAPSDDSRDQLPPHY